MYGVLKARAAFVNVNYRYKAEELRYVLDNGAARAIIYHAAFAPTLAAVRDQLPALEHLIQVRDDSNEPLLPGAVDYETWVDAADDTLPDLPVHRRRPVRPLHRWHHGTAEGRAVAPRGRLLQRARRPPAGLHRASRPRSSCATT